MGKNVKIDIKKRRKRVITGIKRLRANERERARVQKMNAAFMELKQCLPPSDQKRIQTKIDIICYASSFIKSLKSSSGYSPEGRSRMAPSWRIKSSVSVCEQRCCQSDNAPTIVSSRYSLIPNEIFPNAASSHSSTWPPQPSLASVTNSFTFSPHSSEPSNVKAETFNAAREFYSSNGNDQGQLHNMQFAEPGSYFSDSALCKIAPKGSTLQDDDLAEIAQFLIEVKPLSLEYTELAAQLNCAEVDM